MAKIKSAKKRIKTTERNRLRNQAAKSALRTAVKRFRTAVAAGDVEAATTTLVAAQSVIARTARKGVIPRSTAGRTTSRLTLAHRRLLKAGGR